MEKIKISVCMPTFNGEKYIKNTMDSLLNQSFTDMEIIISDDLSEDATLDIIKSYNDSRIKIYKNEKRLGMVKNWNNCFQYATGKYILFLFQDDVIEEDNIKNKVEVLEKNPSAAFAFSASKIIDQNGNVKLFRKPFPKTQLLSVNKVLKKLFRTKNYFGEPSNVIYRKEVCDKAGVFNENLVYTPDWEYSLRCMKYGDAMYINDVLASFRVENGSMTRKLIKKRKILKEDDDKFINSIKEIYQDKISLFDIIIHKFNTKIRMLMKMIFCFIFIK